MTRQPIRSSNLAAVGYDDATQTLEIEFKPNRAGVAAVWQYRPVARDVYDAMLNPEQSAGSLFHEFVKSFPDEIHAEKVEIFEAPAAL